MTYQPRGAFVARREFSFLKHPVTVEIVGTSYGFRGHYSGLIDGAHRILIRDNNQTPFVLAHELVHAIQCERDYDGDHEKFFAETEAKLAAAFGRKSIDTRTLNAFVRREKRRGLTRSRDIYEGMPWEREANERALR